jgi:hypothetical protein
MEGSGHPYHWLHIRLFLEYFSSLYANRTSAKPYEESARSMFVPITFSHNLCTSLSTSCLHFMRFSIHPSRVGIDAGSVDGTDDNCEGSGIFTSSMFVSMIVVGGGSVARGFFPPCTGPMTCNKETGSHVGRWDCEDLRTKVNKGVGSPGS